MAVRRYSPPLERVKEEYARQVRAKVMARRRPPRSAVPACPIPNNSTPWLGHPRTYDDLWYISTSALQLVDAFHARRVPSTNS